jgi:hypothetical protein
MSGSITMFDGHAAIGKRAAIFRGIAGRALSAANTAVRPSDRIGLLKAAAEAYQKEIALLQRVGVLPNELGRLHVADPSRRIATREELQHYFRNAVVSPDELISEAEKDYLYGDEAAAARARRGSLASWTARSAFARLCRRILSNL